MKTYEVYGKIINILHDNPSLLNKIKLSYQKICIDTINETFNQIENRERLLTLTYDKFYNSVSPNLEIMFTKIFNNELIINFNFNLETSGLDADEKPKIRETLSLLVLNKIYNTITV